MVSRRVLDLATYLARHQAPVGRELVLLRVPTAAQQARALAAAQARAPRPSAPRAPRGGQPDEPMFVPLAARCLRGARWSAALPGRAAASAGGAVMTSAGARACVLSCDCRLGVASSEIVRRGAAGIARAAPRRPRGGGGARPARPGARRPGRGGRGGGAAAAAARARPAPTRRRGRGAQDRKVKGKAAEARAPPEAEGERALELLLELLGGTLCRRSSSHLEQARHSRPRALAAPQRVC